MRIATRKASTLAIALAVPAASLAGTTTALADEGSSSSQEKNVTVDVNLGSDAADSDVSLKAGGKEVANETADEDGKVSFSYDAKGSEKLTVEVDGESITLNDAQCTATKESTGSNSGNTTSGNNTASAGNTSPGSGSSSASKTGGSNGSSDIKDKVADKLSGLIDKAKSSISGATSGTSNANDNQDGKSGADNKPSGNSDGSATSVNEALSGIEKKSHENVSSNKNIQGDTKDAQELSKSLKKLESAEGLEKTGIDKSQINDLTRELDNAIRHQEAGNIQITPDMQSKIASMAKSAVGAAAPEYAAIAGPVIDIATKVGASAINLLAENIDLDSIGSDIKDKLGNLDGLSGIKDKIGSKTGSSKGGSSNASAGTSPDTGSTASSRGTSASGSNSSDEKVDLDSTTEDKSFTVDLQDGVSSVDCDVDADAYDDEDAEDGSGSEDESEVSQSPESASPASGSGSASGPKVNTGGEVQEKSFFEKIRELF